VRRTSGISYIELLFVLALLGILAAVAAPRLQMGAVAKQTARTFARQITADLRYTRQLALTHAAGNPEGFELVMNGSGSYSGYSIRNRQSGEILQTSPISPDIQCSGGSTFSFGPLGNLLAGSGTALQAGAGDERYSITVISATGTVLCQRNE
jgi:type II secretory pathway pseudopilin PulG